MIVVIKPYFIKIFTLLSLILYCGTGYGQIYDKFRDINIDSIKLVISESNGEKKIHEYFQLVDAYLIADPDSCIKYARVAKGLAEHTKDKDIIAEADIFLGKACYFNGLFEESIQHYLQAYDYFIESRNMAKVLILDELLVFAYYYSGNREVTANHLEEIISHLQFIPDTSKLAHFIIGIGYFYRYIELYEKAIPFFQRYLEVNDKYPLPPPALALNYGHLGFCLEQTGHMDEAIKCYLKDIRLSSENNMSSRSYFHLGRIYDKMDSLDKAIDQYDRALLFYGKQDNVYFQSQVKLGLGSVYLKMGDETKAYTNLKEALALAEWIYNNKLFYGTLDTEIQNFYMLLQIVEKYKEDKALELLSRIHFQLYRLYDRQSDLKHALEQYISYHQTQEKYKNYELLTAVEEIQSRYESEKKEQKILMLSQQNAMSELQLNQSRIIAFSVIGLFLLTVLIAFLVVRMTRIRSEQKSLILEQRLLRSQMNPHFIFNALSNIANLVESNDNTSASKFLTRFSRMVRHILDSSREEFILFSDEVQNLENYIELQMLRFSGKFIYSITFENEFNTSDYLIPPMLIQPFVENAIEHGIKPKEGSSNLSVRFFLQDKSIICYIEDDGIGRERSYQIKNKSNEFRSHGTQIVKDRLSIIRKKTAAKVEIEIIDLEAKDGSPKGTRVEINLPYRMAL